ncbi:uncharacterized protein LOC131842217 [Achroia grisella]|uniref:uncharacterized protein LOC131842217 n=1 Tax=Achroia grisella TaxID=688607 RepID=UPI0027D2147C|nr:uncharacterized protein LOC131842217 [Achroia grisella]
MIIGSNIFWELLGSRKISLGMKKPILWETRLGWLVSGPLYNGQESSLRCNLTTFDTSTHSNIENNDVQSLLSKFWQLEDVGSKSSYSEEEQRCEEHFVKNTIRLPNGRFCVRIPLKQSHKVLGNSFQRAKRCLHSLEYRFKTQPAFRDSYVAFLSEYHSLGHMTECKLNIDSTSYFIPHHGVLNANSTTTSLRVVFNASSPTSSGVSFNQIQMVGPTVQDDLLSILLRFRFYKYVLAADVEKMYRQVIVHPDDRHLQQILWRKPEESEVKAYQLNTVTYGCSSASYLATRCLKQIGLDCNDKKVSEIIIHDFYVDDLLTGSDSNQEALNIKKAITAELASAGMVLRKWKSNGSQLVIPDQSNSSLNLNMGFEPSKTLGLGWSPDTDNLYFKINLELPKVSTKRELLSVIAQVFDPMGLISPCIISLKIWMQHLWLHKLSWDELVPFDISHSWHKFIRDLPLLNNIYIPRLVVCDSYSLIEIHCFSDASQCAYGACLYIKSVNKQGDVLVKLLLAKSKVAPIKPTTIPRLELCAALVGVRLYEKVMSSLRVNVKRTIFWTDSTIVLGWLKMLPNKLQPFVRNRVVEILEKTEHSVWRHVPTDKNPADHISRGVKASELQELDLWWSGPPFLKQEESQWPLNPLNCSQLPEVRPEISLHITKFDNYKLIDFSRFSNVLRLKRAVAYALRFINGCRKLKPKTTHLNPSELEIALNLIIKIAQIESIPEYITLLQTQTLPLKSQLNKFNIFMDNDKIMRVGGRLTNASMFSYNKKHPAILQSTHPFTRMLFRAEHIKLMHAGPQLLLASIREAYWPIKGRSLAKSTYYQCIRCTRMKGKTVSPLMGNLPESRITPGRPFECVGIDYAGPISSASRQGRGCKIVKVYIAIFVCSKTKAIHIELVGDLTSNSFLCALRRFISRRGKPTDIFSDNGTSFVGAYNEINKFLKNDCSSLADGLANEGISFHLCPPYSPHFGGLWEAGVKAIKHHLYRVLGNCNLTFEELITVLTQIEAILNSRPLTPLSDDPNDLSPLTPAHFLIGTPLTALPVADHKGRPLTHLNRFQRLEQLRQHFWARWSKEYVSELQQRSKWYSKEPDLQLNSLVVVKEDNLPPLRWKMGRIVAVYPGTDGINRVADVKTSNGVVRRSFSKICPLIDTSC